MKKSKVKFDQVEHTYTLKGLPLTGITTILNSVIFYDKYKGVPAALLQKKAEYGTYVHESCELLDTLGIANDCPEVSAYMELKKEHNLTPIASEFLVSDNDRVATQIDTVMSDYSLSDFKTTYTLDLDYISWQLSIAAYLFTIQTQIVPPHLYAIWLRPGNYSVREVPKKTDTQIKEVIDAYFAGKRLELRMELDVPRDILELEQGIHDTEKKIKELKEEQDAYKEELLVRMQQLGVKKWETPSLKITRKLQSTTTRFDSKKFKEEQQNLYNQYLKKSTTKESILITLR